jgi:thiol-disulfide isomerase/thioredoxin
MTRLAGCSSNDAKVLVSLPPGRYRIDAYNGSVDARLSGREVTLTAATREVDLGTIFLPPSRSVIVQRKESKAKGTFGDFTKLYGKKPPAWHVSAARGVSKDVKLSDFQGKWVVLEFWGLSCAPCLKRSIPELMQFYEEHAKQRDRFEILSFCLDPEGELKSLADMDRSLKPVIEHVWGGKTIPFPILLDNTFATWESFGLAGMGTTLLIDPEGNLVDGGLDLLKQKLSE